MNFEMCFTPLLCAKNAQIYKHFSVLLESQRVAPYTKNCSKASEHNRNRLSKQFLQDS